MLKLEDIIRLATSLDTLAGGGEKGPEAIPQRRQNPMKFLTSHFIRIANCLLNGLLVNVFHLGHFMFLPVFEFRERTKAFSVVLQNNIFLLINNL